MDRDRVEEAIEGLLVHYPTKGKSSHKGAHPACWRPRARTLG